MCLILGSTYSDDVIEMIKGCGSASDDELVKLAMEHDSVYFSKVSGLIQGVTIN